MTVPRALRPVAPLLVWSAVALGQTPATKLTVLVRQGQDAVNDVRAGTFVIPAVEVRDERGKPVPDAEVTFEMPGSGPGGSFHGWMRVQTLRSDAQGQVTASGYTPNGETGRFEIRVTASSGSATGAANIPQTNGPVTAASGRPRPSLGKGRSAWLLALAGSTVAIPAVNAARRPGSKIQWWAVASGAGTALLLATLVLKRPKAQTDVFDTAAGAVEITALRHASLRIRSPDGVVYVDPTSDALPATNPRADLVLITDAYRDHFDPALLARLLKPGGVAYGPEGATRASPGMLSIQNGGKASWRRWSIEATPAYNQPQSAAAGKVFHEKGAGNGYLLTFGGKRFYVSGNTGATPEMRGLGAVDAAFLAMSPPYTMSAEEAAEAARAFQPKVVFPYHYSGSLVSIYRFKKALSGTAIDVRIRNWYLR